ncbi:MAG: Ig-like domain-containing protein [Limisphaerales bacterium]
MTFSEPVDIATADNAANYSVGGGITVLSADQNPNNAAQVTLTTGVAINFGTAYTLMVNGVNDLFGNAAHVSGQFARDITIDGSFDDWAGIAPIYSSDAPSGNTGAADFEDIYVYDDANYYYFRVTLWADIDPSDGQFPDYVNMFFDTDDNAGTGYGPGVLGSDMLVQSGFSYQEKNGTFADTNGVGGFFGINGLNWLCLPASPGTNFEFQLSKAATFGEDGTPVFSTNLINFIFQSLDINYNTINQVPASGVISYTNSPVSLASLPLGKLAISAVAGGQAAVIWDPPGTLQESSSLTGSWTNLPLATSPYVIPISGGKQFFRLSH